MKRTISMIAILIVAAFATHCSSMLDAVERGDLAVVQHMVQSGESINETQSCTAPLIYAAEKGQIDIVKYMLEQGADPNIRAPECIKRNPYFGPIRYSGQTALYWTDDIEVTRLLLKSGANPNLAGTEEFQGGSVGTDIPLQKAVYPNQDYEMAALLVRSGANPNIYEAADGKNKLLSYLDKLYTKKPALAQKMRALLISHGAHDLNVSEAAQKATQGTVHKSYRNIFTGKVTTMDDAMAERLYSNPGSVVPITYDAGQQMYLHNLHFVWTDNGQNLYEYYILRNMYLSKK